MNIRHYNLFRTACAAALLCLGATAVFAQARLPRNSQKAGLTQIIGVTDVTISYSRPGVKGRQIWGAGEPKDKALVPYDQVWRTGADEATKFTVSDDVLINGQKLAAGAYSLHTIPNATEWTIIFNKVADQWGSFDYDAKQDALRVKVAPQAAPMQEYLSYEVTEAMQNKATFAIRWEKIAVPFTVEVPDVIGVTLNRLPAQVAAAKADDWNTPYQAANYAYQNNHPAEGATWLAQSLKIKETPQNVFLQARVFANSGKNADAITWGTRAVQMAKAANPKANTAPWEKMIAEWKSKS